MFENLKAGDAVFVVWQNRRGGAEMLAEVTKVGRKYGSFTHNSFCHEQFCLKTGASVHKADSNTRLSGYGFDVYTSEEAYRKQQHERKEFERLQGRLVKPYTHMLVPLAPDVVAAIHKVLDAKEGDDVK